MNVVLGLPSHEIAAEREEHGVDGPPCNQNTKIEANPGMQIEKNLSATFDNVVQRPSVSEIVEVGLNIDVVESGTHVGNDPEDQPQSCPRLANYDFVSILCRRRPRWSKGLPIMATFSHASPRAIMPQ